MKDRSNNKKQKGIVFFTTLVLLGLAVLISAAVVLMVLRDVYTVKRIQNVAQAYYLAEAGVEKAINTLYNNFSWAGPDSATLGAGSYNVTITPNADVTRKMIVSTGDVGGGITRTIKVQIKNNLPPSFDYALLCGGDFYALGGLNITGKLHSNSNTQSGWFLFFIPTGAVVLWKLGPNPPTINGNVSTVGEVHSVNGVINGTITNDAPAVPPPPFDNNFFGWYAANASKTYTTSQTFNGVAIGITAPVGSGKVDYVTYVQGNVTFKGTCTVKGCVVATGNITFQSGSCDQTQPAGKDAGYAAFMCQGHLLIDPAYNLNMNGVVYADDLSLSLNLGSGGVVQNGSFYTNGGAIFLWSNDVLNYVRPHPDGLNIPAPISVLSWTEQ